MSRRLERFRARREEAWVDVWTRTSPKYRIRAVLLLVVTGLLFAGLCVFAFWLRTGAYTPWRFSGYWPLLGQSFNPVGANQITLVDFLLFPISVDDVPIQILIMGLLLASLASVPILVTILYRLPCGLVFCTMIAGLALMPWYGATIALGCVVASGRLVKLRFRYALAILGLLPVVVYFISATRRPQSAFAAATTFGSKLYLPWVLAVLGSCVICGVALWIARIIQYRPGGIAPVLAVLFALPVVLFHSQVGRDELEYRLLEYEFGPNSATRFVDDDLRVRETKVAERQWKESKDRLFASVLRRRIEQQSEAAFDQLAEDRAAGVAACDEFMANFKESRYVPCVLLLKGRAMDLSIDESALARWDRIEHVWSMPSERARSVWQSLANKYPESDPAAVALNRLAIYAIRESRFGDAETLLNTLVERFDARGESEVRRADRSSWMMRQPAWNALGIDLPAEVRQARRAIETIACCKAERPTPFDATAPDLGARSGPAVHPLAALYSLDPHHPLFGQHLAELAIGFPWSELRPALVARQAILEESPAAQLEWLAQESAVCSGHAGCAEVLLRQAEALHALSRFADAGRLYEQVRDDYPGSCWADEARQRLGALTLLGKGRPAA
ncbi:MAG: tetratricopeptide repeat protein [Phycisphaerae bacterium]